MNWIKNENETDNNTEQWPEMDHIQSTNGVNRIDFYKAILLVEGQPIEFIIDTITPITIIPPIINPKKLIIHPKSDCQKRCFVDVNKNPIKFKGEALVEVKTEKSKITSPILITEKKTHKQYWGLIGWINWRSGYKAPETRT